MEIQSIPEAFQTKLRISIISALIMGEKTFSELKALTNATDGNLGAQLGKLEELKYLAVKKEFYNKKPRTTYELTELGVNDFKAYVQMLEELLRNSQY
jgi:DNA-binding HxlR family transcriptional regulator